MSDLKSITPKVLCNQTTHLKSTPREVLYCHSIAQVHENTIIQAMPERDAVWEDVKEMRKQCLAIWRVILDGIKVGQY